MTQGRQHKNSFQRNPYSASMVNAPARQDSHLRPSPTVSRQTAAEGLWIITLVRTFFHGGCGWESYGDAKGDRYGANTAPVATSDMGTTRKRVRRQRDSGIPPQVRGLFDVGCGWQSYGNAEVERLWREHGPDYLATRTKEGKSFAELVLGRPEELTPTQRDA